MVGSRNGAGRRLALLALVAVAAAGATGVAGAQGAAQESEQSVQLRMERAERARAEARRGMERGLEAAQRAEAEARARLERMMPQLRERMPMMAWRAWGSGSGSVERILAHAEELELSDAQVEQVRAAHRGHRRDQIEREAAIEVAELDLEELMRDDGADLGAVESQMMEIARLRVQDRIADLSLRREVDGILTPEQREQLDDLGQSFFRARGDGGHFLRREGPGVFFYRGDGDGYSFRLGDDWHFDTEHWFDPDMLFESLAPLHEMWELHLEEEPHSDDEERDGDSASGVAIDARGTAVGARI